MGEHTAWCRRSILTLLFFARSLTPSVHHSLSLSPGQSVKNDAQLLSLLLLLLLPVSDSSRLTESKRRPQFAAPPHSTTFCPTDSLKPCWLLLLSREFQCEDWLLVLWLYEHRPQPSGSHQASPLNDSPDLHQSWLHPSRPPPQKASLCRQRLPRPHTTPKLKILLPTSTTTRSIQTLPLIPPVISSSTPSAAVLKPSASHNARLSSAPTVEGTTVPNGARVPGTPFVLDPVNGAF